MCNRLPEIKKNGDAGIFPVYYSLNMFLEMLNVAYPTIHYKTPLRVLPSPSVLSYCSHGVKRLTYEMSRTHLLQVVQKGGTVKNIKHKLYEHYYCGKPASSFLYYCGLCLCCPVRGSGLNHAPLAILWAVVDT